MREHQDLEGEAEQEFVSGGRGPRCGDATSVGGAALGREPVESDAVVCVGGAAPAAGGSRAAQRLPPEPDRAAAATRARIPPRARARARPLRALLHLVLRLLRQTTH